MFSCLVAPCNKYYIQNNLFFINKLKGLVNEPLQEEFNFVNFLNQLAIHPAFSILFRK